MKTEVFVYVDTIGEPRLAGRLWARTRKGRESATFEYDPGWLGHADRFALEPALTLGPGPFHTPSGRSLFGAIGDSAPDRWGRVLMRRAERRRAERAGETPRSLMEIDYLLGVDDEARQGALRFALREGGPFLAKHDAARIPPLIELPRLLSAAEHVVGDTDSDEDLRLLLAPVHPWAGRVPRRPSGIGTGALPLPSFHTRMMRPTRFCGKRSRYDLRRRPASRFPIGASSQWRTNGYCCCVASTGWKTGVSRFFRP